MDVDCFEWNKREWKQKKRRIYPTAPISFLQKSVWPEKKTKLFISGRLHPRITFLDVHTLTLAVHLQVLCGCLNRCSLIGSLLMVTEHQPIWASVSGQTLYKSGEIFSSKTICYFAKLKWKTSSIQGKEGIFLKSYFSLRNA